MILNLYKPWSPHVCIEDNAYLPMRINEVKLGMETATYVNTVSPETSGSERFSRAPETSDVGWAVPRCVVTQEEWKYMSTKDRCKDVQDSIICSSPEY